MSEDPLLEAIRPAAQALGLPDGYQFDAARVPTAGDVPALTELRVGRPEFVREALAARPRRDRLSDDGRLVILAADHPARMVTSVGTDPVRMGDRAEYLSRIVRVLSASPVDGLMATADVIEEVVALDALAREQGRQGFLGRRVLIGSMNRSGLQNASRPLWDMPSAYLSAGDLKAANLDGGKVLWRYAAEGEGNRDALETMVRLAALAAEMADEGLPLWIEPLAVEQRYGKFVSAKAAADWVRVLGVASALGPTSLDRWLKIPVLRAEDVFARVVRSTTLPILMLGGPATGIAASVLVDFALGLEAGANVRGALVGRNVLYGGAEDPAVLARAVCHVVHDRLDAAQSARQAASGGRL